MSWNSRVVPWLPRSPGNCGMHGWGATDPQKRWDRSTVIPELLAKHRNPKQEKSIKEHNPLCRKWYLGYHSIQDSKVSQVFISTITVLRPSRIVHSWHQRAHQRAHQGIILKAPLSITQYILPEH